MSDDLCINPNTVAATFNVDKHHQRDENHDGLSIIIPAFNEERGIAKVIQKIIDVMATMEAENEIIVVNDGSRDQTAMLVQDFKEVRIINHRHNIGYGAALKTGIRNAKYKFIGITDADGTYPVDMIPNLYDHIYHNDYEMVVGARTADTCEMPMIRRFPKQVLGKFANYLTGVSIPDINSGLRLMKKESTEQFMNILPNGFSFTTTITLAMITNNMAVSFIPINYFKRKGFSKIRPIYDTLNFVQLIIRTCLYYNPLKVFMPLSFSLVILAFLVLLLSYFFLNKVMDVTFGVIMMTAVIVLAIGMLADLIDKRL